MARKIKVQAELDRSQYNKDIGKLQNEDIKVNISTEGTESIKGAKQGISGVNSEAEKSNSIFSNIRNSIKSAFSIDHLTGFLTSMYAIRKAASGAKNAIEDINEAQTDLQIATNGTYEETMKLMQSYNTMAKNLGNTTVSVAQSADSWLRAGKTMSEANALIKDSTMLSKLGQIGAKESTNDLLAVMNGFNMSVKDVNSSLDAMMLIDMNAATSAGDIATALKYCSSTANDAGLSFNDLAAIVSTVQNKTQATAETVGVFANTILSRYKDIKIGNYLTEDGEDISDYEGVLRKVGVELRDASGEFRDYGVVLDDIHAKWDSLNSVDQAAVIKVSSGTRQRSRFLALMQDYDNMKKLSEIAEKSAGTATDKFNAYLDSIEAKTNTLQASFESMIINSDMTEVYKGILDSSNALVEFINRTDLLKSSFITLGTYGGVKLFTGLGTSIMEASVKLNKFNTALDMVKDYNVLNSGFSELMTITKGLSNSQLRAVLSSKLLSTQQRISILENRGLSQAEIEATLATYGLAASEGKASAATVTFSGAIKGAAASLKALILSSPVAWITLLVGGLFAANAVFNAFTESLSEAQDNLATSYIYASNCMDGLTASNRDQIVSQLELKGISNASSILTEEFATACDNARVAGLDLASATNSEVKAFINEGEYSEQTAQLIYAYAIQKQLANDACLSTSGDIANLEALCKSLGVATETLAIFTRAKSLQIQVDSGVNNALILKQLDLAKAKCKEVAATASTAATNVSNVMSGSPDSDKNSKKEEKEKDVLAELNSELDKIQDAYTKLIAIRDAFNENGKISIDQYQELTNLGYNFLAQLVDENGQLNLNENAFKSLADAKIQELQIQMARNAIDTINGIKTETEATEYLTYANENLRDAALSSTEALLYQAQALAQLRGAQQGAAANMIVQGYEASKLLAGKIDVAGTLNTSSKKDSTTKEKTEKEEKQFNKEFNWIERLLDKLQKTTEKFQKAADGFFSWWRKNRELDKAIGANKKEISANEKSYTWVDEWQTSLDSIDQSLIDTDMELQDLYDVFREEVQFKAINDAIEDLDYLKTRLSSMADLIDDSILYNEDGTFSEQGINKVALTIEQLENAQKAALEYREKYNQAMKDTTFASDDDKKKYLADLEEQYRQNLIDVKSYTTSLISMYENQKNAEVDALKEIISKRKEALQAKKDYYDYDKSIKSSNRDIASLEAQIKALSLIGTAESKAKVAQLQSELADKKEELQETKDDHMYQLQVDALDKFTEFISESNDNSVKSLEYQKEIVEKLKALTGETDTEMLSKILEEFYLGITNGVSAIGSGIASTTETTSSGNIGTNIAADSSETADTVSTVKLDSENNTVKLDSNSVTSLADAIRLDTSNLEAILTSVKTDGVSLINSDKFVAAMSENMDWIRQSWNVKTPDYSSISKFEKVGTVVNNNVHYDNLINVEGCVDATVIPDLKKFSEQQYDYTKNRLTSDLWKVGVR